MRDLKNSAISRLARRGSVTQTKKPFFTITLPLLRPGLDNWGMSDETPKRRWYRFSLLTLLICVTLFVLVLGGGFAVWRLVDESPPVANGGPYSVNQAGAPPLDEQRTALAHKAFEDVSLGPFSTVGVYFWT